MWDLIFQVIQKSLTISVISKDFSNPKQIKILSTKKFNENFQGKRITKLKECDWGGLGGRIFYGNIFNRSSQGLELPFVANDENL